MLVLRRTIVYADVMLSVLIETRNQEDELARTLSGLVPGAVEGVVREVIICDKGSTDHTHKVADLTGCVFLANGDAGAAIKRAKSEWLLVLEPGARLSSGWMEDVLAHAERMTSPARFTRDRNHKAPLFLRPFRTNSPLSDGLVITKRQATALARNSGAGLETIARGLSARRLRATIQPAVVRKG